MLEVSLQKSVVLTFVLVVMHSSWIGVLFFIDVDWYIAILVICACLMSFLYCIPRYIKLSHPSVVIKLRRELTGGWLLSLKGDEVIEATLNGDSLLTTFLIILNFKSKTKKRVSVVMFRDSMTITEFRQLSVLLRHSR